MIYLLPFLMAALSRLHGSEVFPFKIIKSLLWALPISLVVLSMHTTDIVQEGFLALFCLLLCAAGKSTGHGGGIDLGAWTKEREDERLEFIIKPVHGKIPEYYYDVLLLIITGIAAVSGAIFAFLFINPLFSGIMLLSGILKGVSYMIGNKVQGTETSEVLTGLFVGIGLLICLVL